MFYSEFISFCILSVAVNIQALERAAQAVSGLTIFISLKTNTDILKSQLFEEKSFKNF